jgi:hypothetical protein
MVAIRIEDLRNVQVPGYNPEFKITSPALDTTSTLAPVPQTRPMLPAPKHIMLDVLSSHMETERLSGKAAKIFDTDITQGLADLEKISAEKQEALENEARSAKARATWSTLSIVAQYISSAGLIALGASSGGITSALLIAAGGIGILNRAAHDTNLLQAATAWYTKSAELQKKITNNIEMGAFFLQMGLGLAGGFAAWQTGALAAAQISGTAIKTKTASIITGASGVLSTGSKVGASYYDKQIAYLQAQLKELDKDATLGNQEVTETAQSLSKMVEQNQNEAEELRKMIQTLYVSQD